MSVKRGEVYYIDKDGRNQGIGAEQWLGRPGVIVSNDAANASSRVVEVVFLTTQPKSSLPTHVVVSSTGRSSTVLCEQITTIDVARIGNYMCTLSGDEMRRIDTALAVSLALYDYAAETEPEAATAQEKTDDLCTALVRAEAQRDAYKTLYTELLVALTASTRS